MSTAARDRIAAILDGRDAVLGRSVAFAIQGLIVISAVSVAIETLHDLPDWARTVLAIEEIVVVTIFSVEYVLRVWSAPSRLRYVFSFWGVIDLAAILPSLLMLGADLRSIRSFRLLRLFRLLKLTRYNRAAERLRDAFSAVKAELILFLFLSILIIYVCAAGIYYFEHDTQPEAFASIPHSLWWAIATLTTVGYGDVYPVTAGGRIFTFFFLLIGLGIVAVPTALIAASLSSLSHQDSGSPDDES